MNKVRVIIMTLTALVLCAALSFAAADNASVSMLAGSPRIMKAAGKTWNKCVIGMSVDNGDRIKTSSGESVEIAFPPAGNVARIAENSDVFVRKTTSPYSIELLNGKAMALLKSLPSGSTFEVKTPAGVSGARGTGWRSDTDGRRATFAAFENKIYVAGIDRAGNRMAGELTVESGMKTMVDRFEAPSRLERITEREMNQWNDFKKDVEKREEVKGSSDSSSSGGPGKPPPGGATPPGGGGTGGLGGPREGTGPGGNLLQTASLSSGFPGTPPPGGATPPGGGGTGGLGGPREGPGGNLLQQSVQDRENLLAEAGAQQFEGDRENVMMDDRQTAPREAPLLDRERPMLEREGMVERTMTTRENIMDMKQQTIAATGAGSGPANRKEPRPPPPPPENTEIRKY